MIPGSALRAFRKSYPSQLEVLNPLYIMKFLSKKHIQIGSLIYATQVKNRHQVPSGRTSHIAPSLLIVLIWYRVTQRRTWWKAV